jgi:hypothetical protein
MFYTHKGRRHYPREVVPPFGLRPTPLLTALFVLAGALAGCGSGAASPSPSGSATAVVISTTYGRVWGSLPADFPLLADGQPLKRLDVIASGAIWSELSVSAAASAAADELRSLGWEVAAIVDAGDARRLDASREDGACTLTVISEPLGTRTSLVVYLGEGCPQP